MTLLDQDDFEEQFLGFNKRNCILYTKGEKTILHFFKKCAAKALAFLRMTKEEAEQELRRMKSSAEGDAAEFGFEYFQKVLGLIR